MRYLRVVLYALLAVPLTGCGDEPLSPTEDLPRPEFAVGGTDRPISGEMSGELTFLFDWDDMECPVSTVTDAWGTMSHLGKVHSRWSHCPPVGHPGYTNGLVVFTAANGDQFVGEYEDLDAEPPTVIEIVDGTGRFEDASGTIYLLEFVASGEWGDDGLPIGQWSWWGIVEGTFSY